MHAARQALRPKHQVLILKCYPKFQKNNVDVKPNSSELSYLLYYASTRRSKLQKVGDFLEKRTESDVWKGRIGNVQVTLQILKALIEKCPRDLPLYSGALLRILQTVLKSNDITMVEDSVPTFEALCVHQDPANLTADVNYVQQFEDIVRLYAQFASKEVVTTSKIPTSWPVAIRFRKAGLRALKAVASSEALGTESGRQLSILIPVILWNIYSESGDYLKTLAHREQEIEEHQKDQTHRRRQSTSTVHTAETGEGDPIAASKTIEDADKLAEEEVGMVAMSALRNIFRGLNRGQLPVATTLVLDFIGKNVQVDKHFFNHGSRPSHDNSWPTTVLAMICGWTPVQDRYAILVGAMETLIRSPIVESDLEKQLVLATVVDYLLGSPINFIGLSVMDVLVGLISHTLLLLQLGGPNTAIKPHPQQTSPVLSEKNDPSLKSSGSINGGVVVELVKEPSRFRMQLLATLRTCMASLATHVYYTDQIADMVSAILKRLKPSQTVASTAAAIEDPVGAIDAVASSVSLQEKTPQVDKFFSFETARITALEAVKDILVVANARRPDGSSPSAGRSPVGVRVWEGTQWLLRDPSSEVRKGYADALVSWLNLEMKKSDLHLVEDGLRNDKENDRGGLARRAVSNASHREKRSKKNRNTFLALLHLAIYENAHQYVDSEPDLLLLHLVLTTLVNKLGVNSVRSGLPMVLRLQEDIQAVENPAHKIRIGSLVHGYLWALSMALDFETSSVGRALHAEISRRNDHGLWLESIRVPPLSVDRIQFSTSHSASRLSTEVVQTETLRPFDNREALVDKIADGYFSSLSSPPSSPPGSPSRSLSVPVLRSTSPKPHTAQLPSRVKQEMLSDWSKDLCIASHTKDQSSSPSVTSAAGSRTVGSASQRNNYLGINIPHGNLDSANNSPLPTPRHGSSRPPSIAYGLMGRLHSPNRNRSPSATRSTSSMQSALRVDDLKRVLSGSAPRTSYSTRPISNRHDSDRDVNSSTSESMVSADFSLSDQSFTAPMDDLRETERDISLNDRTGISPASPSSISHAERTREAAYSPDNVPPVPPIPASLRDNSASPTDTRHKTAPYNNNNSPIPVNGGIGFTKSRSLKRGDRGAGKGASTERSASRGRVKPAHKKPDFSGFLEGIDDGDEEMDHGLVGGRVKPPY
ncbi:hypothetical protein GQ43DRAFT_480724 [Delitschia confertaspora ATCC 74209]|uniref:Protein EFR3 n=1 Tax=Delitschia confertaspora ATCC 74209 TaxID=1513339 RepID=A0A9P4JRU2_9PLEO|nr:hypothetical protein GQ43DRAFT_480724 [Delitschia confertaspora ATCC 74209]